MRIIPRRIDISRIESAMPWAMVYGRRKTGKTFMVENFMEWDRFFFVNRDMTVMDRMSLEVYTYSEFMALFREVLGRETVVIDEFHRLPGRFLDFLHSSGIKGRLILITSTTFLAKSLVGRRQPLAGLVRPVRIGLVDEREIIAALRGRPKDVVEAATYLREPMLIPSYSSNIRKFLPRFLRDSGIILREIMGEMFHEEGRDITGIYEGIMRAVSSGRNVSTTISSELFSKGIISKDNPGTVQKYLKFLSGMGILERMKVWEKKRFRYFHASPLFDLHYYLESKYSYSEVETPERFISNVVSERLPRHVEQFMRSLLSKVFGLQVQLIERKDMEIDIALFEFSKPRIVAEVKWKNSITEREVRHIEEVLGKFRGCKRILVVPDEHSLRREPEGVEVWDAGKLIDAARESVERELTS